MLANFDIVLDIRDISGDIRLSVQINRGAKGVCSLGGDDYVTLPLVTDTPIPFAVGDHIDLRDTFGAEMGGRLAKIYKLLSVPKPNASPGRYEYELRFDAYYKEWNNKIFKYNPEIHGQEASWSLTAPLDMHLGIFLRNLKSHGFKYNGVDFDYTIDSTVSTKAVAMTYDNMHLLDALYALCAEDKLDCDCWIEDNHIRFGRCEHGTAVTLELGAEVAEMSRSESSGTYANRIYAFGGDRNIPADYRPTTEQTVVNGVVQHRLMLPEGTPYVDARPGLTEAEIVEAVKVFDDIYPKRTGTMSDVHTRTGTVTNDDGTQTTYTYYRYKDTGLVFKDEYILPRKELQIAFTSGKLNGMTFGVIFNPTPKDSARGEQLWEIVANEDYGRLLPDDTLKPEDGNTYILSGFDIQLVSDQYIPDAEQELLEAAQEYVRKSGVDDGSYQATLYSDWVYADRIGRTFDIGQKVLLKNPAYFGAEGRESRITGWEFNLDLPYDSPRYTIGESVQYSRLGSIEDSLEALTYKGQTYTGGGGSGVYVIRTNDTTPASDSNVFSALRSLRQFTRKDIDDIVAGLLSFAKGLQSTGYTSGSLGTGFGLLKDVDGMSYLEIDRIYARYKAIFDNLEVKHVSHVGGEFVVSPAGMKCIRVETVTASPVAWQSFADSKGRTVTDKSGRRFSAVSRRGTVYRCFFRSTDGERTIENQFSVGDQAMCREFNLTGGSVNRYYWRKVISVGADYIDLSATDCLAGSDIPMAQDDIVAVGNDRDTTRQHAVVISSYGGKSPSIMLYTGINSYSLEDRTIFEVTPDGVNIKVGSFNGTFTGKFNIEAGSTGLENIGGYDDLTDAIAAATDAAEQARQTADDAAADATTAINELADMSSDSLISPQEKTALRQQHADIKSEYPQIIEDAKRYSVDYSDYTTAYMAADAALEKYTNPTPEYRPVDDDYADIAAYYPARQTILDTIASAAKSAMDSTQEDLDEFKTTTSSSFTLLQNRISSKVSQTTYTEDMESISSKFSSITQTVDDISLTVQSVGGDNMLVNSGSFRDTHGWGYIANGGPGVVAVNGNCIRLTVTGAGNVAWAHMTERLVDGILWQDGESYTFSVRCRVKPSARKIRIGFRDSVGHFYYTKDFNATTDFQTFTHTFTYDADSHSDGNDITQFIIAPQVDTVPATGQWIDIEYSILQQGRVNTAWQPSLGETADGLYSTGIDISNGVITLRADTTYITDSSGDTVAVFTPDGKLSVQLIDVDTLVARRVKTSESGRRVEIEGNELSMFNDNGELRMKVSGGTLSDAATGGSASVSQQSISFDTLDDGRLGKTVTLSTFSLSQSNNVVTIPKIALNMQLRLTGSNVWLRGDASIVLDGRSVAHFRFTVPQDGAVPPTFTMQSFKTSLSSGQHKLELKFVLSGNAMTDSSSLSATPSGTVSWLYSNRLTEIATDGFRSSAGTGVYITLTDNGPEMRCGNFGLRITNSGLQHMVNGSTWQNMDLSTLSE